MVLYCMVLCLTKKNITWKPCCQEIMLYLLSYWKDNSMVPKKTIMITRRRRRRKGRRRRRTLKDTFQDIGLYWGLDKCATVNVVRGKIVQSTNVNLDNDEQLKTLDKKDKNNFLGKDKNSTQLDDIFFLRNKQGIRISSSALH